MPGLCAVCGKEGPKRCSRCKQVYYCSETCQTRHWPMHKQECNIIKNNYTTYNEVSTALILLMEKDCPADVCGP